jgi:hypothetical protein
MWIWGSCNTSCIIVLTPKMLYRSVPYFSGIAFVSVVLCTKPFVNFCFRKPISMQLAFKSWLYLFNHLYKGCIITQRISSIFPCRTSVVKSLITALKLRHVLPVLTPDGPIYSRLGLSCLKLCCGAQFWNIAIYCCIFYARIFVDIA